MKLSKDKENVKTLWTPSRLAFTTIVLFLVAAFGVSSCSSGDERRPAPPASSAPGNGPVVRNAPAPRPAAPPALTTLPASIADAELEAVSGKPIKLSSYAGKVLVVNLWATWCGPCRAEIPELVKLHKEFRSQGLEVVGLSTEDPRFSAEKVKSFVSDFEMSYRVGWATNEVALELMQGRDSIPQSFVISRDGQILKRFVGFNPITTPPQIREAIEQALAQKSAD
ncbi:MAG TPA: TlpA disulfide reductase family protein [Pyrinomonadaceae bacterium]|nr:TlpA disulfide reductase family protein [Pyrinomonadaceae bacterium]